MPDTVRVGASGPLFHIARDASLHKIAAEHSSFVAILFSALALEAWVNELLDLVQCDDSYWSPRETKLLAAFAGQLERRDASLDLKIQLIATGLRGQPFDLGRQPYQDFALLIRIRNVLVHAKSEVFENESGTPHEPHSILRQLEERGVFELERVGVVNLLYGTLTMSSVGNWCYGAATRMAEALAEMLPPSGLRSSMEIAFGKFPPEVANLLETRKESDDKSPAAVRPDAT
jgi:hypothetical protein